jgi:hypothetical protein
MTAAPILRVGKVKAEGRSTLGSVDAHLSRTRPTHNADPRRTPQNQWLTGGPGELETRVQRIMAKAKIDPGKLRTDATLANDLVLSVSPEWFRPDDPSAVGTWDEKRLAQFRKAAVEFLKERFPGRVAGAVLHLDEATPHVQAVVVPIMPAKPPQEGWRLSGKDMFNPTSLTALQEAWEARLRPLGVGPRQKGSTARHVPLSEFYKASRNPPPVPNISPSPPPPKALVPVLGREALAEWKQTEVKKARKRLKPLEAKAAQAALYEAERRANDSLRGELREAKGTTRDLLNEVSKLDLQVDLAKEEISRLRGVPVNTVAVALGHTGTIGKRENAIDLVKRVGGLDYNQAVAWLHHAFGPETAAEAVRAELEKNPPAPVLSKPDQVKAKAIADQLDALAAPSYRVTLMRNVDGDQVGQNLGKREDGPEKFWSRNEIMAMIPKLTAQNAQGANVFITPIDPSTRHVLVDDLSHDDLVKLAKRSYQPATITQTSRGNYQAVVKVSAELEERATNEWFKALNRDLGDEKITGLRHPFRLAGFQNRKDKHEQPGGRFPFVEVVHAVNQFCETARRVITEMAKQFRQDDPPSPPLSGPR